MDQNNEDFPETKDILAKDAVAGCLSGRWVGKNLEVYSEIDSTNNRAKQLGLEGAPHGTLIISDLQTAGKGRRGRGWLMPRGEGLTFSILTRPQLPPDAVSMLTLAAALAVSKGIDMTAGCRTQIKWPNDIVLNRKKICGILTEGSADSECVHYAVVGIGVNVSSEIFPRELKEKASSIYIETGKKPGRIKLLNIICSCFEDYYAVLLKYGDLSALKKEYDSKLAGRGNVVVIEDKNKSRQGICLGITERGSMLVRFQDGKEEEVLSGEVSVRGLYGYI